MQDNFEDFQPSARPPSPASAPPVPEAQRPVAQLASALAKAQGKMIPPLKNRTVDFTDSKGRRIHYSYADLADVIDSIRGALSENELCVIHRLDYTGGRYGMSTDLIHASGEKVSTWYPLPDPGKNEIRAQEFGSALTYARRYSLSALIGIASEEDDDGASAPPAKPGKAAPAAAKPPAVVKPNEGPGPIHPRQPGPVPGPSGASTAPTSPNPPTTPQAPQDKPNASQRGLLFATAGKRGWTNDQLKTYILTRWSLASTSQLTLAHFEDLLDVIQKLEFSTAIASAARARSEAGVSS